MAEEANITMDEARGLVSDAALWPRVRDFLWDFAAQVHPSWLNGLTVGRLDFANLGETVKLSNCQSVKRYVLDSLGVEPFFHSFPKDDWSRLALLDGATLLEISKWLGALACSGDLRRVTDGKTVKALKAALPGVYPEVFGFTEYFKSLTVGQFDGLTVDAVVETGREMLAATIAELPEQLKLRFKFKLPKPSDDPIVKPSDCPPVKPANLRLLLKLKFPEAHSLCC